MFGRKAAPARVNTAALFQINARMHEDVRLRIGFVEPLEIAAMSTGLEVFDTTIQQYKISGSKV